MLSLMQKKIMVLTPPFLLVYFSILNDICLKSSTKFFSSTSAPSLWLLFESYLILLIIKITPLFLDEVGYNSNLVLEGVIMLSLFLTLINNDVSLFTVSGIDVTERPCVLKKLGILNRFLSGDVGVADEVSSGVGGVPILDFKTKFAGF